MIDFFGALPFRSAPMDYFFNTLPHLDLESASEQPQLTDAPSAMQWAWSALTNAAMTVGGILMGVPLRALYFDGPSIGGIGFWAGASPSDVCSRLTGVPPSVWEMQPLACEELRERKFRAFSTGIYAALYIWGVYKLGQLLVFRYVVLRPAMVEVKDVVRELASTWRTDLARNPPDDSFLDAPYDRYYKRPRHPSCRHAIQSFPRPRPSSMPWSKPRPVSKPRSKSFSKAFPQAFPGATQCTHGSSPSAPDGE